MENHKGMLSHFGGVIRLIILIVCIAIIAFFVIRFVQSRGVNHRSQSQSTQVVEKKDKENTPDEEGASRTKQESEEGGAQGIPSGISEGTDMAETNRVPEVGMGFNVLLVAVCASLLTYVAVYTIQRRTTV